MDTRPREGFGPPDDTPILPWYGGRYTRGFVALHPFFTVPGLDPARCEHGTLILEGAARPASLGLLEWADAQEAMARAGEDFSAESVDALAKRSGKAIGWRAIGAQLGLGDHCAVDRALRTTIGGLRKDLADPAGAVQLTAHCSERQIFPPSEGRFAPIMQSALAAMFREAGFPTVAAGNEFGDEERSIAVDLLESEAPGDNLAALPPYGIQRLIAPDRSLLAWVHWDSFYTLILGTEQAIAAAKPESRFEGFWCSAATETYWLRQPCIPLANRGQ